MEYHDTGDIYRRNIYRLSEEIGIDERKIIDFSTGINPLGLSKKVKAILRKKLKRLHYYPDPDASRLKKIISRVYDISPDNIIMGNGTTQLIHLIVRSINPSDVLIIVPCYSEFERAVLVNNEIHRNCKEPTSIDYFFLEENDNFGIDVESLIKIISNKKYDLLFISNPNSITGRKINKQSMSEIAEQIRHMGCFLVVDESFVEFCSDITLIDQVSINPYLIVLRSFSFFYGFAGLRIGYGVFHDSVIERIRRNVEPWNVNTLAQAAAAVLLKDKKYVTNTLKFFNEEKSFFEKGLRKAGIDFIPSYTHSYLIRVKDAEEIVKKLSEKGILVDDCSGYRGLGKGYIRVTLMKRRENMILIKVLMNLLSSSP